MAISSEKTCTFYASDYHLEMIMLPYINKNLKQNKQICVFTQNNLEETINTLVKKINLKEEDKKEILNIDWSCKDENKYNNLEKIDKESIIFIKGNKEYIEKTNNNLQRLKMEKVINIVDCYNIDEVENKEEIANKYKQILVTNGIHKL